MHSWRGHYVPPVRYWKSQTARSNYPTGRLSIARDVVTRVFDSFSIPPTLEIRGEVQRVRAVIRLRCIARQFLHCFYHYCYVQAIWPKKKKKKLLHKRTPSLLSLTMEQGRLSSSYSLCVLSREPVTSCGRKKKQRNPPSLEFPHTFCRSLLSSPIFL